ncbi:MAG: hypothetical protein OMM_11446 [Candidatus Magnetoglobus multicellularis str. Araruama]|uniref:DUF433 domain-containing protein n=1 Tax=Candidatus Magnetoglobus multicellularis str. Araruama TaxID=890399 RepID=A0A1V1NY78_9BACT|nr:MAG: hypothetical protein OMM_11446 [Candidatus Magnetoglobus multicellularis str. Araruama]
MKTTFQLQPTIVKTYRGLTIAGTRITLDQIMDYIKAKLPDEIIREHFRLTIKQVEDILLYIQQHYDDVEAEYQKNKNKQNQSDSIGKNVTRNVLLILQYVKKN